LFAIIAVPFDAYQALPRSEHRWLATCLARYTDRDGKCWPTMRQLAADARLSLSTVSRRLKEMADLAVFQRTRKGVGRYVYQLAEAYRPRWPGRGNAGVSARQIGVSQAETPDQVNPEKQIREARGRARFADRKVSFGAVPDPFDRWTPRVRSWRKSGFWLAEWGPKPNEAGCLAPAALLTLSG
jgi:hypothetical protein